MSWKKLSFSSTSFWYLDPQFTLIIVWLQAETPILVILAFHFVSNVSRIFFMGKKIEIRVLLNSSWSIWSSSFWEQFQNKCLYCTKKMEDFGHFFSHFDCCQKKMLVLIGFFSQKKVKKHAFLTILNFFGQYVLLCSHFSKTTGLTSSMDIIVEFFCM